MIKHIVLMAFAFSFGSKTFAGSDSYYGFNVGLGVPYLAGAGLSYHNGSNLFGLDLNYNVTTLSVGSVAVNLNKPEFVVRYHPLFGALYLGLGLGYSSLSATSIEATTGQSAKVEINSVTVTPSIGFRYGIADGGLFIGFDIGYQKPLGASATVISSLPSSNSTVTDTKSEAERLGEQGFPVISILRLGYLF